MPKHSPPSPGAAAAGDSDQALLEQLDRLEELLEEMDELGVRDRADIERLIAELEAQTGDDIP